MTQSTKPQQKQYGEIKEGFFLRTHIGDATAADGTQFELATAVNGAPIVLLGKKAFILSWQDICEMAADAGLFDK